MPEYESKNHLIKIFGKEAGSRYQSCLEYFEQFEDPGFSQKVLNRLLKQEKTIDRSSLRKLTNFAEQAEQTLTPEVKIAREELRDFFRKNRDPFELFEISLVLYGSLEFNDPRNMDADLEGFTYKKVSRRRMDTDALYKIADEDLLSFWTDKEFLGRKREEPHLLINSFNDLLDFSLANRSSLEANAGTLSMLISGTPLFPEDREKIEKMRAEAIQAIESDPFILALVNIKFPEVLKVRQERKRLKVKTIGANG